MFGSFPTQEAVDELEREGVKFFVNLTYDHERMITPYTTKQEYISFPIIDRQVPRDWKAFACFIVKISNIIGSLGAGELVYIHCKGGHGRAGVVVASLMCHMFNMKPDDALEHTSCSHSKRHIMRDRWRTLGSPQTSHQKRFIHNFFEPINFYRAYNTGHTAGFSTFSMHRVEIDGFGRFPTAEAAIQAYKCPDDPDYVSRQEEAKSPVISKNMGRKVLLRNDWLRVCDELMYKVLKNKFDQYPHLKESLMNTGFRPIIQHTRGDSFWGDGGDGNGHNKLGKALARLREYYYNHE